MSSAVSAVNVTFALLSGVLLGLAFPPADWKWLVWVGLVPLLQVVRRSARPRRAFVYGYLAGLAFFLLTLHPLVSAHAWTGWAVESQAQFAMRMNRQWWFMHGIWIAFSVWCALFWGAWALALHRWGTTPWRTLLLAPSLWVLLPEWARAQTTFGFTWAFLGNATADLAPVRQLGALGGIWLLSALAVVFNTGLTALLRREPLPSEKRMSVAALGLFMAACLAGAWTLTRPFNPADPVSVAVIQRHKARYDVRDFLAIGMDRGYVPMIQEALGGAASLVVLPESIALGATMLDESASATKPPDRQTPRRDWDAQMRTWLSGRPAALIVGLDTIERGHDHNTLVTWTNDGAVGWYHKRRLVPFAEYLPEGWNRIAIRGRSQYSPGHGSQLIRLSDDLRVGGFICQEVLFPWVTRASARDGATLLVSGGNDGVFADPAVAKVHADAAQLRAVETGRYLVRAMKTGISAVIDPWGREQVRSRSSEPILLRSHISPRTGQTPYVRFGDWVVWLSLAGILLAVFSGTAVPPRSNARATADHPARPVER